MSSICTGIVKIEDSKKEFKDALVDFVEKSGWGILFN